MPIIETIVPAQRRSLTTPSRFRDAMAPVDISDEALDLFISRASAMAERYCGRVFAREHVREEISGCGLVLLLLERTPIVAVHSVLADETALESTSWAITAPDSGIVRLAHVTRAEWLWEQLGGPRMYDRPSSYAQRYTVEYVGGYSVPGEIGQQQEPIDLPADLEHAVMLLAHGEIVARDRTPGVTAERIGDASWTYGEGAAGMSAARPILDHYKRPVI